MSLGVAGFEILANNTGVVVPDAHAKYSQGVTSIAATGLSRKKVTVSNAVATLKKGRYKVEYKLTAETYDSGGADGTAGTITAALYNNGTLVDGSISERYFGAIAQPGVLSASAIVTITAENVTDGDNEIELHLESDDAAGTGVKVTNGSVLITPLE